MPSFEQEVWHKNIATEQAKVLLDQDIQRRIKEDRERRKKHKEDEAHAASLTNDDLDCMAYQASSNVAALEDMKEKAQC